MPNEQPDVHATASALLAAASDPAGTKVRLEELRTAQASHDQAAEKANAAIAEADRKQAEIDHAMQQLETREAAYLGWVSSKDRELDGRAAGLAKAEELNRDRAQRLEKWDAQLQAEAGSHTELRRSLEKWLLDNKAFVR